MKAYDNTVIKDFLRCPRFYYFRHVRDWVLNRFEPATAFGTAWGEAAVAVWQGKRADAFDIWLEAWKKEGGPAQVLPAQKRAYGARTPEVARLMLSAYWKQNQRMIEGVKVLGAEMYFEVPVGERERLQPRLYSGLLDLVVELRGVCFVEMKSTAWSTPNGGFVQAWIDGWKVSDQITGYLYSARTLLKQKVTLLLDTALVHTSARRFDMIRQTREPWQMEAWERHATVMIGQIEAHTQVTELEKEAPVLHTFPRNTNACFAYNKPCAYWGVCHAHPNPEQLDMPASYRLEPWVPRERAKGVLGLTQEEISTEVEGVA